MSDTELYELELVLFALGFSALAVFAGVRLLERRRPDLRIRHIIFVALGARILAALAVSNLAAASSLRGGDESTFLANAQLLARWSTLSWHSLDVMTTRFHVFAFSLDFQFFGRAPDMMLRLQVITLATLGLALLVTAVYELAGPRAAVLCAWILALEPANVFFSGILHKEPFMLFAEGLVAFGGAVFWKRGKLSALVPMIIGCLLAVATRPYVGWFLAVTAAVVTLHGSIRWRQQTRAIIIGVCVLGLTIAFVPVVWNASSKKSLAQLQASQDANASDNSNLALERIDYSSREKVIVNLPKRVADITTRPYPWQVSNTSQQLGVLGTLSMGLLLIALIYTLITNGGKLLARAGPVFYPLVFLLIAYSLSAGNAGTAFRYRTHIVAFIVALVCVLRYTSARGEPSRPRPIPARERKPVIAGV